MRTMILFFLTAFLYGSCAKKVCKPELVKEDNKKFQIEFFTRLDTVPDAYHISQINYYGMRYLKRGYDKQFFRVWFLGVGAGDHFVEVYIDSTGKLGGEVINAPEHGSFEKKKISDEKVLCKLNNSFIENQFTKFHTEEYYYNDTNMIGGSRDFVFHFEYASANRYKNSFFANPYIRSKRGMEDAKYPMQILDAIYDNIDDNEIRRVIDSARNEKISYIRRNTF
jgi:hypothetical protein